jgi:hypothetical protein
MAVRNSGQSPAPIWTFGGGANPQTSKKINETNEIDPGRKGEYNTIEKQF